MLEAARARAAVVVAWSLLGVISACAEEQLEEPLSFSAPGSLSAPSGKGSFRFGASTAATQIEDKNLHTDWYLYTRPVAAGGLGKGSAFVGDASLGYTKAIEDIALLRAMHLDAYRFSIEWARVEPRRGVIDEVALQHYSELLDALLAAGIRPMITVHHFSNPVWVDDPRDPSCRNGPNDENLCGLGHPTGGALVIEAMARHARLLGERFGDRVDEWLTLNEPMIYLTAAYGVGHFPPAKWGLSAPLESFVPVLRDYLGAHAGMYKALKDADRVDADGDGAAASVGFSQSVSDWAAARGNLPSSDPVDLRARDGAIDFFHHLFVDSLLTGSFNPGLNAALARSEQHPEWRGTLDWLGLQYYARMGVTGEPAAFSGIEITPCIRPIDSGACLPPLDTTFCVPKMGYEFYAQGLYGVLEDFSRRWPELPLVVTEAGIATRVGKRRAENVVRILEQIARAIRAGADVRGYYHWSLIDNFEWADGFGPTFGLYSVDYRSQARSPTEGAEVLGQIAASRTLSGELRVQHGGEGPMTPETSRTSTAGCPKITD